MFYFFHLGHQVSPGDELRRRPPTREDQLHTIGLAIDEVEHLVDGEQAEMNGDIDLIENHDIVVATEHGSASFFQSLFGHGCILFGFGFDMDERIFTEQLDGHQG